MDKISLIIPCYNEEEVLHAFYEEASKVAQKMEKQEFEFLFVDDGSKDQTLSIIKKLRQKDKRIRYISFSRNFGKEAALYAGFQNCTGDYAAVIDADLQHPPAMIPAMYEAVKEDGCECAAARRKTREGEPKIRSMFSRFFYRVMKK